MKNSKRVAFVTGGVSGLGFGIARALSNAGFRLALSYRNEDYRAEAERWFAENGRETPIFLKLDVTDRARFAEVAREIEATFGRLDVLVNNAGVSVFGPTDEASHADYDWIMGVNFGGVVNGLVALLPLLKRTGPGSHVVNVASMAAYLSGPQAGIYTASKFAVRGLTESLRYNLAPQGIGVSLLCPGLTRTNAWDSAFRRPETFGESGFGELDRAALTQFGAAFDLGMDPLEVGEKALRGIEENAPLIFSHPEYAEDFREIYEASLAALPDEPAPAARLEIERLRREGNRAAAGGRTVSIADLT
ncbi:MULTISPECIES: SDR family oxidoreductase [unclassified Novosphingobium]|uniref:SDR family oxidoreductase n=1 Tax=unclassified Novosphingobium TaxID=2644732 RepID=UPI0006C86C61|nr:MULTISPECIES: SDR family oxidoreductase [unclassified Novosphingobium]KPH66188.1 short-chain dehydrogenase [Novosphingobium sp. ST904]MPS69724.1 SDR family oxidoreductase [Novosphingobium sp.]TCM36114.1 NADP-dependent 3-hydroxy acid dehydrogenase YdfG [Novosphingobium sp. ST904]WRT94981.1 SDR family oxidoreductase [Novosphingobium sp. RL4]